MGHPLTSKERRGLAAVAAAALLCVSAGFIVRSCGHRVPSKAPAVIVVDTDTVADRVSRDDSVSHRKKSRKQRGGEAEGKRKARKKSRKAVRTYPTREPLDQPCD